jgi:hypothetical protein
MSSSFGEAAQRTGFGTTTSAGAAGGTTLIDVDGVAFSGVADTYNGRYWVRQIDGANQNRWKRIVNDDGAGTLTLENNGFESQVASGVRYEIWLMPDADIVVAEGGSTTTFYEDAHDEPGDGTDGFWVGYWACPLTGSSRGEARQITQFDYTGGANEGLFTVGVAFTNAMVAGDVIALVKFVEVQNFSAGLTEDYHRKISNRVNFSRGDGVIGARSGQLSFETDMLASGALSADTVLAARSVLSPLLQAAHLVESRGKTCAIDDVGAASTTTSLKIDTATHENFDIGACVIHQGNMTRITAKTDGAASADTLTVSPPLPTIPNDNDLIYGTTMWRKTTDGDVYGCTIEFEQDGIRHRFWGCKGNVEVIDGDTGKNMLRFTFTYDHYVREVESFPVTLSSSNYSSALPIMGKDKEAYLDTTQVDIRGFTATPGCEVGRKGVSGRYGVNANAGTQLLRQNGGGTFQQLLESGGTLDSDDIWQTRTSKALWVTWGSHDDACAVSMPVARLMESPHPQDIEGMVGVANNYEAQDAGTATDPTDGVVKVPDFAIHLS